MKCYSDEHNPGTLKLLLAAKFANKKLNLQIEKKNEVKTKSLMKFPWLELEDGTRIYSNNVAARYIFEPENEVEDIVDLWIDCDTLLKQALGQTFSNSLIERFGHLIDDIEKAVKQHDYLVGKEITAADIILWSTFYMLLTKKHQFSQFLSQRPQFLQWYERIEQLSQIKEVLSSWKPIAEPVATLSNAVLIETPAPENNIGLEITDQEIIEVMNAWKPLKEEPKCPSIPVLPKSDEKNILITSALPYVNNVPHLGNIIGCVLSADVFARYCRLRNWNTLYIAGTDEYGTATETKAIEENLTPQQICDKYFQIHQEVYEWFGIKFDHFGRTSTEKQKEITQELFLDVYNNGYTSVSSVEQLMCRQCNRFLADRFVEGTCPKCMHIDARGDQCDGCGKLINAIELITPRCKICHTPPVVQNSNHLFLNLTKLTPKLQKWFCDTSSQWTNNAKEITNAWLKEGLKPRCITRDLKWGIPVPLKGFEDKVFYVWFDAPIGYMSITACYTNEWRKWWQPSRNTKISLYQFMAKDNVPFHSIMFPATLFAVDKGYILVNNIMATEYLNYEDDKFSKSRGIGVFGTDAKDTNLPSDIFRFYLLYVRPESHDSSFSWDDFATKHNSELLNNIGNFTHRSLSLAEKFFDRRIPEMTLTKDDYKFLVLVTRELKAYCTALEKGRLKDGIRHMLSISRYGNQYFQGQQPWIVTNNPKPRAGTVVGLSCNVVCLLAILIQPYMPTTSRCMRKQLNAPKNVFVLTDYVPILLNSGHRINVAQPIFVKIESDVLGVLKARFSGKPNSEKKVEAKQKAKHLETQALGPGDTKLLQINGPESLMDLAKLDEMIANVGGRVREMKSKGEPKSTWQPMVDQLLALKSTRAQLIPEPAEVKNEKKKKKRGR